MAQTAPNHPVTLEIDALSYGPYGIGRLSGKAVMIPHSAPGDIVEARIIESKHRYDIGEVARVLAPSPSRQIPPCPYVGRCGGCSWQHLRYAAQLKAKEQSVADALRRIGKLAEFELRPILPAFDEYGYRRRIRLQVSAGKILGFYATSSHQLVEIDSCIIADERLNSVLDVLRDWIRNLRTSIEYVEIIAGDEPGEIVAVAGAINPLALRDETLCADLICEGAKLRGLILDAGKRRHSWGKTAITVALGDLTLTVDADVFTQVNAKGNRQMLNELVTAAKFQDSDRVLELYCGAGNFTLPIARAAQEVIAVEGHPAAIANGKLNAQKNGLTNIRWISSAVPVAVGKLKQRREKFAKIVLDPPRAGAKGIESNIAALGADQIFYISCNPTTLARDLAALSKYGYRIRMLQPIDFFPQTFHVETLAVIER